MPNPNPLSSILGWLHEGYPDGVPPKDFYPLLALLARTLSEEEVDEIVGTLIDENPDGAIDHRDVHEAIEQVKQAPPNQADVRDVAARLAMAGWPLGDPDATPPRLGELSPARAGAFGQPTAPPEDAAEAADGTEDAPDGAAADARRSPGVVQRMIDWLDIGYPEGIPATDRVPILALLRRRLTDDEAEQIARALAAEATDTTGVTTADAEAMIADVTQSEPSEAEIDRVAARLAARGWPLQTRTPRPGA